jgi:hypothetical protein
MPLVKGKAIPDTWHAPTLSGGYSNSGSPYNPAGYLLDTAGVVHLRGTLIGGYAGQNIFVLPVGYRPQYYELLPCIAYSSSGHGVGMLQISPYGEVAQVVGGTMYLYLDGVSFKAFS